MAEHFCAVFDAKLEVEFEISRGDQRDGTRPGVLHKQGRLGLVERAGVPNGQ